MHQTDRPFHPEARWQICSKSCERGTQDQPEEAIHHTVGRACLLNLFNHLLLFPQLLQLSRQLIRPGCSGTGDRCNAKQLLFPWFHRGQPVSAPLTKKWKGGSTWGCVKRPCWLFQVNRDGIKLFRTDDKAVRGPNLRPRTPPRTHTEHTKDPQAVCGRSELQ